MLSERILVVGGEGKKFDSGSVGKRESRADVAEHLHLACQCVAAFPPLRHLANNFIDYNRIRILLEVRKR